MKYSQKLKEFSEKLKVSPTWVGESCGEASKKAWLFVDILKVQTLDIVNEGSFVDTRHLLTFLQCGATSSESMFHQKHQMHT